MDPYRQHVTNVSVPNPDTPVQFYRSTRPKAPLYAMLPENRDFIECSKCRHLFLPDMAAARAEHRQWHEDNYDVFMMPCRLVDKAGGHYDVIVHCQSCTSHICPCHECQDRHVDECQTWKAMHVLSALDAFELADILWDHIEQQRDYGQYSESDD